MEYRNIFLANPARLSVQREQLVIEQAEKITVPLEDISSVLIESQQVTLSVHAAAAMANHGITVFLCDEKHLPSCQLLPINQFCRQRKLLLSQCETGKPLQKQLWQQIVVRKIQNQAQCLRLMGKEEWQELQQMAGKVLSNDSDNREAVAAALYFPALFGNGFFRGSDDPRNAALNYGYAVMRAGIARNLVVHGLEPCIGLHHRSELNNFNLADDLIEPFRPVVDLYVTQNFSKDDDVLTPRQKAGLFNLTNYLVKQAGRRYRVMLSIDRVCMALANSVTAGENLLELPELIPLELHQYEWAYENTGDVRPAGQNQGGAAQRDAVPEFFGGRWIPHGAVLCVRPYLQRPGFRGDPQEKNSAGASIKGLCADAGDH